MAVLPLDRPLRPAAAPAAGLGFVNDRGPAITAPFSEEWSTAAGFLLFLTLAPELLHSPRAALVTGAFIGLGFQILEDDLYTVNGAAAGFHTDQSGSVFGMAFPRMLGGRISHEEIHGHRARHAGKHALEATIDLAHALAESGGRESDGVTHARAQVRPPPRNDRRRVVTPGVTIET